MRGCAGSPAVESTFRAPKPPKKLGYIRFLSVVNGPGRLRSDRLASGRVTSVLSFSDLISAGPIADGGHSALSAF